jgi:hypothetical protein
MDTACAEEVFRQKTDRTHKTPYLSILITLETLKMNCVKRSVINDVKVKVWNQPG